MTDINELIASLPPFLQDSFKDHSSRQTSSDIHPTSRRGLLANIFENQVPEPLEVKRDEMLDDWNGKISPGIWAGKGTELSIWRDNGTYTLELSVPGGGTYRGIITGAFLAEGGFGPAQSAEDRVFGQLVYELAVEPAKQQIALAQEAGLSAPRDNSFTHCASALWSNRDRSGPAVPRAFLTFEWKSYRDGQSYPTMATLLDGENILAIKLEKQHLTNKNQPMWKGVAR